MRNSSAPNCILNPEDAFSSPHVQFSKLVTVANVLLGSGVIGGALSFWLEEVVDSQEAWYGILRASPSLLLSVPI